MIKANLNPMRDVAAKINGIAMTLNKEDNLSSTIKTAHSVLATGFIFHMSKLAVARPEAYKHVYEWNRNGDHLSRLWRHKLAGRGKNRLATFTFLPSRKTVPVEEELKALGVEQRHVFTWKAPIIEYGLPVNIRPQNSPVLVFFWKNRPGSPLIITKRTIRIPQQGTVESRGAFTQAFNSWWTSDEAERMLSRKMSRPIINNITDTFMNSIKRSKTVVIKPRPIDMTIGTKLEAKLNQTYTKLAGESIND